MWVIAAIAHYAYLGAQYTVSTSIVSPRSRATTVSVMLLIISLIGNGIGPLFTGMMSSAFMGGIVKKAGLETEFASFNPGFCAGAPCGTAASPDLRSARPMRRVCASRWWPPSFSCAIAAAFYFLASRTYAEGPLEPRHLNHPDLTLA